MSMAELPNTAVMGILNVTPDSFSDGGDFVDPSVALKHCAKMLQEGAHIIDVGAESTRPGSAFVDAEEEMRRLTPIIRAFPLDRALLSVDTNKPDVQIEMLHQGAHIINDVMGGNDRLFEHAARCGAGVVLMHSSATPDVMQAHTDYGNVVDEVFAFLQARVARAKEADVPYVWCDPGIGFGKTLEQNIALMRATRRFASLGDGVLLGASRKSWLWALCEAPVEHRLGGSLAAAIEGARMGAAILRVHDVLETVQALTVMEAFKG